MEESKKRMPSVKFALFEVAIILLILIFGRMAFNLNMHILLICTIIAIALCNMYLGHTWKDILKSLEYGVTSALAALFFFFLIGMAVAAWMACGCLPSLIYYGLNLISPAIFLPTTFILCSIVSFACGSSWTTGGTIGIVLLGIGITIGFPEPLIVGCIVAGAYFGDKMSPVSDTTNLSSITADVDLFEHIKAMVPVTAIAWVISFVIYWLMGLSHADAAVSVDAVTEFQAQIAQYFNISPIAILPLILVLVLSIMRVPAIPTLLAGIFLAVPIGLFTQGLSVQNMFNYMQAGVTMDIPEEFVAKIVNRGGIQGMMKTFSMAVIAMALGGIVEHSGALNVLVHKLVSVVKNKRMYPALTIFTAWLVCLTTGEQYLAIVLTGQIYKGAYDEAGYERRMLSRNLEEGGTVSSPVIPWSTAGVYFTGALGVATAVYAPYVFLNYITSVLGILLPLFGLTLMTKEKTAAKLAKKAGKAA